MRTADAALRWADAWERGWEALDAEPILARYAADAILATDPFRDPYRGRHGVAEYVTRVFGEEEDPRVFMARPIVDGDRAAVSWWSSVREEGSDTTLAGTSVLRFDADGLVAAQWDTWNQLPARRDPPDDFGPFRRDTW